MQLARAGLLARVALWVLEALRLLQVLPVRPAVERHLHHVLITNALSLANSWHPATTQERPCIA